MSCTVATMKSVKSDSTDKSLSKKYQKKTDREHILDAPDTYIGSIEPDQQEGWMFQDGSTDRFAYTSYTSVPGLYKCFDEGIVNARDHFIRMRQLMQNNTTETHHPVTNIQVDVNSDTGMISICNDGDGIDVAKHPEHDIWIPEMIFGHLRTSTNYQKDEKRIVGGKNGFGFKLVLIYSTWGKIETVDHKRGLKYVQEFHDNLTRIGKPKVTKCSKKPYTRVSWIPDYKRFNLEQLTPDMERIFKKRTYDISCVTDKNLKVKYNSNLVPVKTFEQYVNMFVGDKSETKRVYEYANDRWEYAVCLSTTDEFSQVSFVNGIHTSKGGKHVEYVLQQITKKVVDYIEKKKKVKVKSSSIKEQIMLFVNCVIENPSFDSQTKDTMNTSVVKFGSTCKISDKFIEKVAKLGIMDQAISIHKVKECNDSKKTDGKKTKKIYGIPKLIDANFAGTAKSSECTLILCEGDSAKAGIVSGLSKEDRNFYGVYPLKGKLMNVRDMLKTKVNDNKEITDIKKIMGLESYKVYKQEEANSKLRYGKIMILTDQDLDGVHIKGLCLNMFDNEWSTLVKNNNFIGFMNTPILKAKKGTSELCFYNDKSYTEWKKANNDGKGWNIKYYKGLGTSTSKEFKEYFKEKKIIYFTHDETSSEALDKVFRKNRSEDRKDWLKAYNKNNVLDTTKPTVSHKEFVDQDLIHFSKYDCERSIPNLIDGLKTSQRKILYCAFKRNLTKEIKVAQFGGYVSEHSGYHHGEMSLMQAIVGMAQDFVGSNNLNLLLPNGQFGTRLQGGSDSASERYIFTQLSPVSRLLFHQEDDAVLTYLDDDGTQVEPEFYVPIIPTILVNGSVGIGTGFSTNIPCYNPLDIIRYIKSSLGDDTIVKSEVEFHPWYRNFQGEIIKKDECTYLLKGVYEVTSQAKEIIRITELPVGTWLESYKIHLEKCMNIEKNKNGFIKEYSDQSTDKTIDITITFVKGTMQPLLNTNIEPNVNGIEKALNLVTTKKTSNMHVFDENQRLIKVSSAKEMIDLFLPLRRKYYVDRKTRKLNALQRECTILHNKARFILEQCNDTIDLRRKKKDIVVSLLKNSKYDVIDEDTEYKYLRNMPIDSVIEENIDILTSQRDQKQTEYKILKSTTIEKIWMNDIVKLEEKIKTMYKS
jgi:DNA topoisomerase-2